MTYWRRAIAIVPLCCLLSPIAAFAAPPAPRIATLSIPGDARFVAAVRDVLLVQTDYTPDFASSSGLIDDAIRVPSFTPEHVAGLTARIRADMTTLRALPWRTWTVDQQIDVRWIYANAERIDRELSIERLYTHRPGAWLETLANNYIAILTYAPERTDAMVAITAQVPAMVGEMASICHPTATDVAIAKGLADGIVAMLEANNVAGSGPAIAALTSYEAQIGSLSGLAPFAVVGAEDYAWRLKHASLLPWDPEGLRRLAERELGGTDAEIVALGPQVPAPRPLSPQWEAIAANLTQSSLLALYDAVQIANLAAIQKIGFVTVPAGVGPIHARVTPAAMIPLTGDGGSMNPPPPFVASNVGWWNVEHFNPNMPLAEREKLVRDTKGFEESGLGPYAAHEGVPGHHLQLSIARLNPDPIRNLFVDPAQVEGWALYAEGEMWEQGGLGNSAAAHIQTLESWRLRIRRVVYDVNVETSVWSLQQAADWKHATRPGKGTIDPDVQRSINWPAQLIGYFSGREEILALKDAYKKKVGRAYSERTFNDELLALGSVPYVFARAKMLGEPVPDF